MNVKLCNIQFNIITVNIIILRKTNVEQVKVLIRTAKQDPSDVSGESVNMFESSLLVKALIKSKWNAVHFKFCYPSSEWIHNICIHVVKRNCWIQLWIQERSSESISTVQCWYLSDITINLNLLHKDLGTIWASESGCFHPEVVKLPLGLLIIII